MYNIKKLGYKEILDINELNIPEGKVTCILGESGSGKTTLLRILNKLISHDRGIVEYNGTNINEIDSVELRREVVMLSQEPGIFKGTIRDNLLIGLRFAQRELVDDEVLRDSLVNVKLNENLDDNSDKLSGGEKQRLALARIILLDPKILLLDEPSSALDDETEELIINRLVDMCRYNSSTLIMVTHSNNLARTYGDNIIILRDGKVIKKGGLLSE